MEVTVLIHLEIVQPDDSALPKVVFWARSEDAPGFYAAADHVDELLSLCKEGLADQFGEEVHVKSLLVQPESNSGSQASVIRMSETIPSQPANPSSVESTQASLLVPTH